VIISPLAWLTIMEETDEYDSVQWDIQDATTRMDDSSPFGKSRLADTATIDPLSDIADSMNSTLKLDNNFDSQVSMEACVLGERTYVIILLWNRITH
jgi:3-hydroxyacyl-CoA dehydrogenase